MKIEIKEISQVVRELTLTVEADVVMKEYNKALKKVSKMAPPIAGFRKGKAPLSAIEKNYGEYVKDELYRDGVDKYLNQAIKENEISSISEFFPQDIQWEKGDDLVIVFKYEVTPTIELNNIDGVKVPFLATPVSVAVDKQISDIVESNSQMTEVDDNIISNDAVEFEFTYTFNEEEIKEVATVAIFEYDKNDAICQDALGKKIGDSFETSTFAYRLKSQDSREDEISVTAMVNSIQRKTTPAVDEAFAKSLDYTSVEDMKEKIALELAVKNDITNREARNRAILGALVRENDFEIPSTVLKNYAYETAKMYSQGAEPAEQMLEIVSQMVVPQIKELYVVEKLKELYPIEVTEAEIETYIAELAAKEDVSVEDFKAENEKEIASDDFKKSLKVELIIETIFEKIEIVDPEEFKKETEAKTDTVEDAEVLEVIED